MADKTKKCKLCNKVFEYAHINQKYCSDDCVQAAKKKRRREYNKKYHEKHKKPKKPKESKTELGILQKRADLRKIIPTDTDYKLRRYIVKVGENEKKSWMIERDYYFFKPCKFDKNNENLYYIHDFNDKGIDDGSLIKLTDTSLSEKEFEYYKNKGNLVFYEKLH